VLSGSDWHRLINSVWSPLYPLLLGIFRRIFNISAGSEIAVCHVLNVVIFIFAFASFELLLRRASRALEIADGISGEDRSVVSLPKWAVLAIAYSLFLRAAIDKMLVGSLRADLLMSGFLYLGWGAS